MDFQDVIEECIRITGGGKSLAAELNISQSEISRIRSLEGKLSIPTIEKLIEIAGLALEPSGKEDKLKDALRTMSALWQEAENKIERRNKK